MTISIEEGDAASILPPEQQSWLTALGDAACGEDLEYDNDFLQLQQAAAGKPETQFAAAEPPNWREVQSMATGLFERTRDLRAALLWTRAQLNFKGLPGLPEGLALIVALLETHWEQLHPQPDPDDGDPYARLNALAVLSETDGLIGDLRAANIFVNRSIGELTIRDVEIALGKLTPREGESGMTKGQASQMLDAAQKAMPEIRTQLEQSQGLLKRLNTLLRDQVGIERTTDTRPLHDMLAGVLQCMPEDASSQSDEAGEGGGDADAPGGSGGVSSAPRQAGLPNALYTREDALKAIELVCDYLERTEPTNPAQLLLRRARKLINKNFLQLMRELAPDAINEVARIMGVDPDTIDTGED